jgi:hypothetical protein
VRETTNTLVTKSRNGNSTYWQRRKREMEKIALGLRDIFIHQHRNLTQEIKGKMNVLKY